MDEGGSSPPPPNYFFKLDLWKRKFKKTLNVFRDLKKRKIFFFFF